MRPKGAPAESDEAWEDPLRFDVLRSCAGTARASDDIGMRRTIEVHSVERYVWSTKALIWNLDTSTGKQAPSAVGCRRERACGPAPDRALPDRHVLRVRCVVRSPKRLQEVGANLERSATVRLSRLADIHPQGRLALVTGPRGSAALRPTISGWVPTQHSLRLSFRANGSS
jgi:hypothetical protein